MIELLDYEEKSGALSLRRLEHESEIEENERMKEWRMYSECWTTVATHRISPSSESSWPFWIRSSVVLWECLQLMELQLNYFITDDNNLWKRQTSNILSIFCDSPGNRKNERTWKYGFHIDKKVYHSNSIFTDDTIRKNNWYIVSPFLTHHPLPIHALLFDWWTNWN